MKRCTHAVAVALTRDGARKRRHRLAQPSQGAHQLRSDGAHFRARLSGRDNDITRGMVVVAGQQWMVEETRGRGFYRSRHEAESTTVGTLFIDSRDALNINPIVRPIRMLCASVTRDSNADTVTRHVLCGGFELAWTRQKFGTKLLCSNIKHGVWYIRTS